MAGATTMNLKAAAKRVVRKTSSPLDEWCRVAARRVLKGKLTK